MYLCNMKVSEIFDIFNSQIVEYHKTDSVDALTSNPFANGSFGYVLWEKNYIDTVQWHLEDLIRPSDIDPVEALALKRRIDASNQRRTDMVERIDDYYWSQFLSVQPLPDARINTETPAWAIDRLSILALKIYHFDIEVKRKDVSEEHHTKCLAKFNTLLTQKSDLMLAIEQLLDDLAHGAKVMKLYRQMKMYNDPSLNPALYQKK